MSRGISLYYAPLHLNKSQPSSVSPFSSLICFTSHVLFAPQLVRSDILPSVASHPAPYSINFLFSSLHLTTLLLPAKQKCDFALRLFIIFDLCYSAPKVTWKWSLWIYAALSPVCLWRKNLLKGLNSTSQAFISLSTLAAFSGTAVKGHHAFCPFIPSYFPGFVSAKEKEAGSWCTCVRTRVCVGDFTGRS